MNPIKKRRFFAAVMIASFIALPVSADPEDFKTGPLIKEYGPVVAVPGAAPLPKDTVFNVAFDVTERDGEGTRNRRFESAARFLNMHAAAGVSPENMSLAVVIHGAAVADVTLDEVYGGDNVNAELIATLLANRVRVIVCGQSAAFRGVKADDLLPGVEMAVSAMTAHALLQQKGYTLNPF